ncbi:hypothetical protein RI129_008983 [Pyrocoelia pectoralis]|uniref:Sushi domain-containing protein n=1 Tax=Pyrocoelia pectoralis TaxID=417401 RepID=A0AAN7ZLK1_9COLE
MNVFYLLILLTLCYEESNGVESSQPEVLHETHTKVRFVQNKNQNATHHPYWPITERIKRKGENYNNQNATKLVKIRRRKKNRIGTTPRSLNITEIIGYLNENNDDNVKVLNPVVSGHFNDLGHSILRQNDGRNSTVDNVIGNLKDLHKTVERFECDVDNGGCSQFCSETSQRRCGCFAGFLLGSDNKSCLDINECTSGRSKCSHLCINTHGSYRCACPRGLRLDDDQLSCVDVNECLLRNGHGPCQDICVNSVGSYKCSCSLPGTRLSFNRHSCEDINECAERISGCSHGCINVIGGAFCTCPRRMELGSDHKTCVRAETENSLLDNMEQNDAPVVIERDANLCPPLVPPKPGFFYCPQKKSGYSNNREDSLCQLVCPSGYKTLGDYKVMCNSDGSWTGSKTGKCLAILERNFNPMKNYIDFIWDYPKPKIICSASRMLYVKKEQRLAYVSFSIPKTNVDWSNVVSYPPEVKKNLDAYLPQGHHWVVFKATHPETKLTAKCIISIIVKREPEEENE